MKAPARPDASNGSGRDPELADDLAALHALRSGHVDALVLQTADGEKVFTLQGADHAYRTLVESMPEGAASLSKDLTVLYANGRLGEMLGVPLTQLVGAPFGRFVAASSAQTFAGACEEAAAGAVRGEIELVRADGCTLPARVALTTLPASAPAAMTLVLTDLTDHRRERMERIAEQLALLISTAGNVHDALQGVLRHSCEHLGCPRGEAWLSQDDGAHFARSAGFGFGPRSSGEPNALSIDAGEVVARASRSRQLERATGTAPVTCLSAVEAVAVPILDGEDVVCVLVFVPGGELTGGAALGAAAITAAAPQLGALIQRKLTESRLLAISEELQLRSELLDLAHDAVIVLEPGEHRVTYWNREAQVVYGYSAQEARGQVAHDLLATVFPEAREAVDDALAREGRWVGELRHTRKDGTTIVVSSRQALHRDADGRPIAVIELNSDVTAQRQTEESNQRLAAVVQSTHDAVLATSAEELIIEWNRGAQELYGYTAADAIGQPASILSAPEHAADDAEVLRRVAAGDDVDQYEIVRLRKDGSRVPVSLTISPIRDASGQIIAAAHISRDISDRKRHEDELAHLADHDPLTGLYNRRRFQEELKRELARARRERTRTRGALLAIDLDHFKFINDSQGHHAGDRLIIQVAECLHQRLRATDVIGRLGGDEFAVLLRGVDQHDAHRIAVELLELISNELDAPSGIRRVTASIGVAPYKDVDQLTAEDLFVEADIAMYDAKEAGRDRATVYDDAQDRHRRLGAGLGWADRIRGALTHDSFVLHAQPILSLNGDPRARHELLVRMVGDHGELIAPGAFLPIAERMNLIKEIDRWVLHNAIATLALHQRSGADIRLQVNLSALSIADPNLPEAISEELRAAGADGRGLCLEITESTAIINIARAKLFAARIAELGCELALDDFGAGYASFHYLKHLAFDYLKIDGEFIQNITQNPTDHLVVQTLANIAKTLGKQTVAEYVQDHQTVELLRNYGVDYAQGYYLGKPAPLDQTDLTKAPVIPAQALVSTKPIVVDGQAVTRVRLKGEERESARWDLGAIPNGLPALVGYWDRDLRNRVANDAYVRYFGISLEQLSGMHVSEVLGPDLYETSLPYIRAALAGEEQLFDRAIRDRSGATRYTQTSYVPDLVDGVVQGFCVLVTDITQRREAELALEEAERRFRLTVESVVDYAILMLDADGHVASWNAGARRIKGYRSEEIIGRHFSVFYPSEDVAADKPAKELAIATAEGRLEDEGWRMRKDGTPFWANVVITALHDPDGRLHGYCKVTRDLTERRGHEQRLAEMSHRRLHAVTDSMGEALCTLDHAGRVSYINPAGERLLGWGVAELQARTLHEVVHPRRRDGSVHSIDECPMHVGHRARVAVRAAEDTLVRRDGSELPVSWVLTPVQTPEGDSSVIVITDNTKTKLAQHKLHRDIEQLEQVREVHEALDEQRFELFAQPIIDLRTSTTVSHELLLRMRERDGTIRTPDSFLPAAEYSGAIHELDRWVIREATRLASAGHHVELNISADSLGDPDLADDFIHTVTEQGADPALIVVELTETALMPDDTIARTFVQRIRALGCEFALDDFGTGFGTFSYLKSLPIDYLKIDVDFVRDLRTNAASRHVVEAVVALAYSFGHRTIAEGVEDEETLQTLKGMGVDYAQGYLIGRPAPLAATLCTIDYSMSFERSP